MPKRYSTYTTEDFIKDEGFVEWVKQPDSTSDAFWKSFVDAHPFQRDAIQQAKNFILQLDTATRIEVDSNEASEIWQLVEESISQADKPVREYALTRWKTWVAAAAVLLAGITWWNFSDTTKKSNGTYSRLIEKSEQSLEEVVNTHEKELVLLLPDGSKVRLEKNSRLSYVKSFDGAKREVYLSGAAFFDVTKNPDKPFIVYANELVTKVLGTSFSVNAFEDDKRVTVAVKSGKVSVFANRYIGNEDPETKGLILVPNQQVAFSRDKETLIRSLVSMPKIIVPQEELKRFSFNNAPVTNIFEALEKVYGVEILYDEELMSGCHLTTLLTDETLFERLDVICEAVGATYKVVDAQVVVAGKNCN